MKNKQTTFSKNFFLQNKIPKIPKMENPFIKPVVQHFFS